MIKPFDPIHDMQYGLLSDHGKRDHRRNKSPASIKRGTGMAAIDIIHQPVRKILQRQSDTSGLMVLEHGKIDQLIDLPCEELCDIGALRLETIGILTGSDQSHFQVVLWVISIDIQLDLIKVFNRGRLTHSLR